MKPLKVRRYLTPRIGQQVALSPFRPQSDSYLDTALFHSGNIARQEGYPVINDDIYPMSALNLGLLQGTQMLQRTNNLQPTRLPIRTKSAPKMHYKDNMRPGTPVNIRPRLTLEDILTIFM